MEKDLIGEISDQSNLIETGRQKVNEGTPFQRNASKATRAFQIQSGVRRRHPDQVLNQFKAAYDKTSKASEAFDKSMRWETERYDMPKDFRPQNDIMGLSTQLGVVTTADTNYRNSKNKLERMHLVGV